jgi:hypothetical protein
VHLVEGRRAQPRGLAGDQVVADQLEVRDAIPRLTAAERGYSRQHAGYRRPTRLRRTLSRGDRPSRNP